MANVREQLFTELSRAVGGSGRLIFFEPICSEPETPGSQFLFRIRFTVGSLPEARKKMADCTKTYSVKPWFLKFPCLTVKASGSGNRVYWFDSHNKQLHKFSEEKWVEIVKDLYRALMAGEVNISSKTEGITYKEKAYFPDSVCSRLEKLNKLDWALGARMWHRPPDGVDMDIVRQMVNAKTVSC